MLMTLIADDTTHNGLFINPRRRPLQTPVTTQGTPATINPAETTPPATDEPNSSQQDAAATLIHPSSDDDENENNNLYVTEGHLFKGVRRHIGDLHLSSVDSD